MLPAQKFREIVFQLLFSYDHHQSDPKELANFLMGELKVSKKALKEAEEKVRAILAEQEMIDSKIREVSTSYDLERIHRVERAILRLSAYELLVEKKLDIAIVIAEAKRLAKKFSTQDAASFCQALLDALAKL